MTEVQRETFETVRKPTRKTDTGKVSYVDSRFDFATATEGRLSLVAGVFCVTEKKTGHQ